LFSGLRVLGDLCGESLIDEKRARFLKYLVEFLSRHFSNRAKTDMLFEGKKPLRTNEAWLAYPAALAIAVIQRNGKRIPVPPAGDLAKNQIRTWKIGNYQRRPALSAIGVRKRYDNDFARYRFDHAASSEFQSRPRTDSLTSAPLNGSFSSESSVAISSWFD
jgi:hypothetical protein